MDQEGGEMVYRGKISVYKQSKVKTGRTATYQWKYQFYNDSDNENPYGEFAPNSFARGRGSTWVIFDDIEGKEEYRGPLK